jgi:hypothetical protein
MLRPEVVVARQARTSLLHIHVRSSRGESIIAQVVESSQDSRTRQLSHKLAEPSEMALIAETRVSARRTQVCCRIAGRSELGSSRMTSES